MAEIAGSGIAAKPGTHRGKVLVHRGGKTFEQERNLRDDEAPAGPRQKKQQQAPEKKDHGVKLDQPTKDRLNKHANEARGMKPGESKKINGVGVTALPNGFFKATVEGKPLIVHGLRGVSFIIDKLGSATSTATALSVGDIHGKTVKQEIGAKVTERLVESQAAKARAAHERSKGQAIKEAKQVEQDTKRAKAEKIRDQKRAIAAKDYASKLTPEKVDQMDGTQVINAASKLGLSINDEDGNVHSLDSLRAQVRNSAKGKAQAKAKPEKKQAQKKEKPGQVAQPEKEKPTIHMKADITVNRGEEKKEEKKPDKQSEDFVSKMKDIRNKQKSKREGKKPVDNATFSEHMKKLRDKQREKRKGKESEDKKDKPTKGKK